MYSRSLPTGGMTLENIGMVLAALMPEQAIVVTRILEGIYESARTGKPYSFD